MYSAWPRRFLQVSIMDLLTSQLVFRRPNLISDGLIKQPSLYRRRRRNAKGKALGGGSSLRQCVQQTGAECRISPLCSRCRRRRLEKFI